jgi:UDP-N-acetyl-D-galactosamine dehydrogenase
VADAAEALHEYRVDLCAWDDLPRAGAIVAAVNHREFRNRPVGDFLSKLQKDGVITDVKSMFETAAFAGSGIELWRL